MKCKECEKAIYTYRELSDRERQKMELHMNECNECKLLYNEVQQVNNLVLRASKLKQAYQHPEWLTDKIMSRSIAIGQKPKQSLSFLSGFFDVAVARYAMATASCCLLLFFLMELTNPLLEPSTFKGPIAGLQGVILNSENFRNNYVKRKEKERSILAECTSPLKRKIDLACLKEKVKKLNF